MRKRIIAFAICLLLCFSECLAANITFNDLPFNNGLETTEALKERQDIAHTMAECARQLGFAEDSEIILCAQDIWHDAQITIELNNQRAAVWEARFQQYPYATYIWIYLTEQCGYNNYVAAGILGNIMSEVGGHTLNIQYWLGGRGYYGMCQWNRRYFPGVQGAGLEGQCQFLSSTIQSQFGSSYTSFIELQDYSSAALMFAKKYERCASFTYASRQRNAAKAYSYFVG